MEHVQLRTDALEIRREIEVICRDLWLSFTIDQTVRPPSVEHRLTLVAARVDPERQRVALAAARRAFEVYSETSDALHGRTRGAAFNSNRVADWRRDVERLHTFLTVTSPSSSAFCGDDVEVD